MSEELRTDDFDYELPRELIASRPLPERGASRMLVVDRAGRTIRHDFFSRFPSYLQRGDLCVLNDTRVVPARFLLEGGKKEILRLEFGHPTRWRCLVRPGKRFQLGHSVSVGASTGIVTDVLPSGERILEFTQPVDADAYGSLALPPYMEREQEPDDRERYQTVYAREAGAIAAPTAGLHFTRDLLATLPHVFVTLHVGAGTFQPVKAELVKDHAMHAERYSLSEETVAAMASAKRVIAVGTTVTRVLEHAARNLPPGAESGETNIFIYPPYRFRIVGGLLTNFHLPKSTLLMLVSAFADQELILRAYREAVAERYRFYSYGDCMLIL